jgi:hypothetical protein
MSRVTRPGLRSAVGAAAAVAAVLGGAAPLLGAGEISIRINGGRVTLLATDAPLAAVLEEWSRVGDTRFVGAEPLHGELITLHLVDASEPEAIRLLLRSAAGYVAAPRRTRGSGVSRYDRVTIMATRGTSSGPVRTETAIRGAGAAAAGAPTASNPPGASAQAPALVRMEELQRLLDPAFDPARAAVEAPAPVDRDELQRLLDAASDSASAPAEAAPAPTPVVTTPFPGVGADPGTSPLPERWRRMLRRR